jgi:hypothetical protein
MKTQAPLSGAAAPPPVFKTGSQIIVDTLRRLGVEFVFGYPGAAVVPLFDCLYKQAILGFVRSPRQAKKISCRAGHIPCISNRKIFA